MASETSSNSPKRASRMSSHPSIKTTLFARIVLRISIPLIILAAIFSVIQLTNQIQILNELNRFESRFILETIYPPLQKIGLKFDNIDPSTLALEIKTLPGFNRISDIDFYHYSNRQLLFDKDGRGWSQRDMDAAAKSIEKKHAGERYLLNIDKEKRRLVAYIPIMNSMLKVVAITRIVFSMANLNDAIIKSRSTLFLIIALVVMAGIEIARSLAKAIIDPIRSLNEATREIIEGHFGKHVEIHTSDEIQVLANTFNDMSNRLIDMRKNAEDSNPLTQLPGNNAIFQELKRRIHERNKFVMFHIDIDRFKVFNDTYGLAKGDEVLKKTGELLNRGLTAVGAKDDFIGHQGGDDFVIICRASHADKWGQFVVDHFDKDIVPTLYSKEDYERGHTLQMDRRRFNETGEERMVKFPLISISLAGVSNAKKDFADYYDCMERAVPAKKASKSRVESCFVILD